MIDEDAYRLLVRTAKERRTISYGALAVKEVGVVLDAIADQEVAAGRPLLPVVVVNERTGAPGAGLFKYARAKGLQKTDDDVAFFASEIKRVYEYWASHEPPAES